MLVRGWFVHTAAGAGLALGVEDDTGGIDDSLLGWQGAEPVGHRVGADGGSEDAGSAGDSLDAHDQRKNWEAPLGETLNPEFS